MLPRVFISYRRPHEAVVRRLVQKLAGMGVDATYDRIFMRSGDFARQIQKSIDGCSHFMVILTDDVPGATEGWVEAEISYAISQRLEIQPCKIGDWPLPMGLQSKIGHLHDIRVPTLDELPDCEELWRIVSFWLGKDKGAENAPRAAQHVERWYRGLPSTHDQALALAIALLPGIDVDTVFEHAADLEEHMEGWLDLSEDERWARGAKTLGARPRSEQLKAVLAHVVTLLATDMRARQSWLEFDQPGWGYQLLAYVWREQDDVRAALANWLIDRIRSQNPYGEELRTMLLCIGWLAQTDLRSVRATIITPLLGSGQGHFGKRLQAVAELLSHALEMSWNREQVAEIFRGLYDVASRSGRLREARLAALIRMIVGPVAARHPEFAVSLLKGFRTEDLRLPAVVAEFGASPALLGVADDDGSRFAIAALGTTNADMLAPIAETVDAAPPERPAEGGLPAETEEGEESWSYSDAAPPRSSASVLQSARLWAAIADWANEPAPGAAERFRRQVPLYLLLRGFDGLPLFPQEALPRISLQNLMHEIYTRDARLVESIVCGFRRAGLASKLAGSEYRAGLHMRGIFRAFAKQRDGMRRNGKSLPQPDPFLLFAGLVHHSLRGDESGKQPENLILDGSEGRYLDSGDVTRIVSWQPEHAAENEGQG